MDTRLGVGVGVGLLPVTVNRVDPETLPEVAVMVVDPAPTAVARPVLLIVAVAPMFELHVTEVEISFEELSEYVPVAVNCSDEPAEMLGVAGVTWMDTRLATTPF